jgi:TonB family protein
MRIKYCFWALIFLLIYGNGLVVRGEDGELLNSDDKIENSQPVASDDNKTITTQTSDSKANMIASRKGSLVYPHKALEEGKEGDVRLRVVLDSNGHIEKLVIIKSAGDPLLDKAALNFVRRCYQFKPYEEKYQVDLVISFRISNDAPVNKSLNAETRL